MRKREAMKNKKPHISIGKLAKKHAGTIIIGVIIGVIVVALTPFVNKLYAAHKAKIEQKKHLSEISLGLSYNYINSILGNPIIENSPMSDFSQYQDVDDGLISTAGYKLDNCVVLCMYDNNNLAAFAVVVSKTGVYDIPQMWFMDDWKLLDSSYYDFSKEPVDFQGSITANNDDFLYYYEIHYGGGPLDYNSHIVGSYKDYNDETWIKMAILTAFVGINDEHMELSDEDMADLIELRQNAKPNVYGIVASEYADRFNFVRDVVGSREVGAILFNDWR